MRCRLNNRRNGHNGGTNVQQGLDMNSSLSTTVANSTISGSMLGPCSTHCHSSSLLDPSRSNHHCGCGCPIANYPLSLQHYSQTHNQHHSYQFPHQQYSSRPYRNMGNAIHPVIDRPDTCAWDSCDDR